HAQRRPARAASDGRPRADRRVGMSAVNPLAGDLDHVLAHTGNLWEDLRGERIFLTGGTGFVGTWLLESLLHANDKLDLDVRAVVLTRDPERFHGKSPHLAAHPAVRVIAGDVGDFEFPESSFPFVIHAATNNWVELDSDRPLGTFLTDIDGT